MKIAVIILHYKNISDSKKCLESVLKMEKTGNKIAIYIVDNNPFSHSGHRAGIYTFPEWIPHQDGYRTVTRQVWDDIEYIHNNKNLGFAGGMNVGIRKALSDSKTDYILILNNDTILPKDFLNKMFNMNDSGQTRMTGDIVGPVIKFRHNGNWVYDFGGKINWWTGRTTHVESTNQPINQSTNKNENEILKQVQDDNIDYVSGCCMLVRREVFEKIGLFDEKFFFYFEDVDICVRAKRAGFQIIVNTHVTIEHKLSSSIGRWSYKAIFYNLWSNFIFITKHFNLRIPIGYSYLLLLSSKIIFDKLWHRNQPSQQSS